VPAHPRFLPHEDEVHEVEVGVDLVQLLLVGDHDAPRPGELQEVAHLLGHGVGVDAHGEGPQDLGGELRLHPLGGVVAQDGEDLAFLKVQGGKPPGEA